MSDINAREYDAWKLAEPPDPEPKPCERCGGDGELDCPPCNGWVGANDECEICHGTGLFKCPDCAE